MNCSGFERAMFFVKHGVEHQFLTPQIGVTGTRTLVVVSLGGLSPERFLLSSLYGFALINCAAFKCLCARLEIASG